MRGDDQISNARRSLARFAQTMHDRQTNITARVQNHSIALPTDVEVPEGTEVWITLPEPSAQATENRPMAWMDEFVGAIDGLPPDMAERHTEYATIHSSQQRNDFRQI